MNRFYLMRTIEVWNIFRILYSGSFVRMHGAREVPDVPSVFTRVFNVHVVILLMKHLDCTRPDPTRILNVPSAITMMMRYIILISCLESIAIPHIYGSSRIYFNFHHQQVPVPAKRKPFNSRGSHETASLGAHVYA